MISPEQLERSSTFYDLKWNASMKHIISHEPNLRIVYPIDHQENELKQEAERRISNYITQSYPELGIFGVTIIDTEILVTSVIETYLNRDRNVIIDNQIDNGQFIDYFYAIGSIHNIPEDAVKASVTYYFRHQSYIAAYFQSLKAMNETDPLIKQ